MSEDQIKLPFSPGQISCRIEFTSNENEKPRQIVESESVSSSLEHFRSIAQNFVTQMQVLWQYAHEVGAVAEQTSLMNLANLPSLLREIDKRSKDAPEDEKPVATIVFTIKDKENVKNSNKSIPIFEFDHAIRLSQWLTEHAKALRILNETVLQQMVNSWERALGDLVSWKLKADPESIPKDRTISYSQLLTFSDFDEACHYIVEEEVANFLKTKTTTEQLKYIKDGFGSDFLSQFQLVGQLCEIILRRHAVVHAGGLASSEYCRRVANLKGLLDEHLESGKLLPLNTSYIKQSWSVIYSAGVVLTHSVAKVHARDKKSKKDEEEADTFLINAAYNAIKAGQLEAAKAILNYAHKLRLVNSGSNLMVLINLAQTYKWSGEETECIASLEKQDWKSCSADFRLCVAALREDEEAFSRELEIVAKEKTISISELLEWPVFQQIRKRESFTEMLRNAYGEDIIIPKESAKPKMLDFKTDITIKDLIKGIDYEMAGLPVSMMGSEED